MALVDALALPDLDALLTVVPAWHKTGLATPLAMMPEIHETTINAEGVSSMAPVGDITIAPGESVVLEPGGLHAMLMRLQEAMTEGESFPLTLTFSDGGEVTVDVPILGIAARGPEG